MYTYAATALIAATVAATGAWKVQSWRFDAKEKERAEQQLENERMAAKATLRRAKSVIEAQSAATSRMAALRRDADSARAAADGLRRATEQAMRDAATSHAACTDRTAAFGELLGAVEEAGRSMAQKADIHANDARKVIEAWPK